jgi:hypothetical protein
VPLFFLATSAHFDSASDWLQIGPASIGSTIFISFEGDRRTSQTDILPGTVVRHWPSHVPPLALATPGHFCWASPWLQIGPASAEIVRACAQAAQGSTRKSSAAPAATTTDREEAFIGQGILRAPAVLLARPN